MIWKFFRRLSNMKPVIWILGICFLKVRMLLTAVFFLVRLPGWQPYYQKGTVRWRATSGQLIAWELQKRRIRKILLDLTVERLNTDVLFCHAVMISPSSYGLKARIRNVFVKAEKQKKGQILMGILVVLFCAGTCFYEIPFYII